MQQTHISSVVPVVAKSISLYVSLNPTPMHDLSGLVRYENLGDDVQLELLRQTFIMNCRATLLNGVLSKLQFESLHHKAQLLVEVAASIYRCPIKQPDKFLYVNFLKCFHHPQRITAWREIHKYMRFIPAKRASAKKMFCIQFVYSQLFMTY